MKVRYHSKGTIPFWLEENTSSFEDPSVRLEIEAKFIIYKEDCTDNILRSKETIIYEIEQFYLPLPLVKSHLPKEIAPFALNKFSEWRIRKKNDTFFFTCKHGKETEEGIRKEYEVEIDDRVYAKLKNAALTTGTANHIRKKRYIKSIKIGQEIINIEVDDYFETGRGPLSLDFVTCEIVVPSLKILELIRARVFQYPELQFLSLGVDATGVKELSNKYLSQHGFNKNSFREYKDWLRQRFINDISDKLEEENRLKDDTWKQSITNKIVSFSSFGMSRKAYSQFQKKSIYLQSQGALSALAFGINDSLGRPIDTGHHQKTMDRLAYGWLNDFHTIVSSDPYLRLSWKPQVFRPGLGHNNTTTRGAHTLDVIACSTQISRQLGLNSELCMAISALHDIGHPAGGHVGEENLRKLSGRKFKHHVFSLSLAELFHMNLLREVQVGAFFHKSSGKKLETPPGLPQEYGVVQVSDKIAYVAWDFFDSVRNGFIPKEKIKNDIYKILGQQPLEWINTMIKAVVIESANQCKVSFTELSGEIYNNYVVAKSLIYDYVHDSIEWARLKTDYELVYEGIQKSFPDLDPVPIIAYMTDAELVQMAKVFESLPKKSKTDYLSLSKHKFGFLDIINILKGLPADDSRIYYVSVEGNSLIGVDECWLSDI